MAFDSWNNKENLRTLRDSDIVINFSVHPEFFAKNETFRHNRYRDSK